MTTAVRVAPPRRLEREHAGKRLLHVRHLRRLIARFTEQLGTAIANAQAQGDLKELAQEQAALRRVATLVAHGTEPGPVFRAVADEVGALLGTDTTAIVRFEPDGTATLMGGRRTRRAPGSRFAPHRDYVVASVRETGHAARFDTDDPASAGMPEPVADEGIHSALASPIMVEGELWGTITVASLHSALPADTERRLAGFTELVATAIANTESRARVDRLTEEQAALRRVATLVAHGADAGAVFDSVAVEIKGLWEADYVAVCRYEPVGELTVLAHRAPHCEQAVTGTTISHEGDSVETIVRRTLRPARMESYQGARGRLAELARAAGVRVAVGTPIVVDGRLWGVVSAGWSGDESPPADTEQRMAQFGQLVDTAIANADSRGQLTASRARLLTACDEARRRVVRDLHDGAQRQLVDAIVALKLAQRALRENDGQAESLLGHALSHAEHGHEQLRELAHGILPSVLTHGGLRPAVRSLVTRRDVPVRVHVPSERFPAEVEASAYFIVAEALTNVVKHSQADRAEVSASVEDGMLRVEVRDDGRGGADPGGHGLVGMSDRVAALGGRLDIDSPPGAGTRVTARIPLSAAERISLAERRWLSAGRVLVS